MGLPAVREEHRAGRARAGLVVVPEGRGRAATKHRASRACAHDARCREAFAVFCAVAAVLALLGMARVTLAARAAALAIESGQLTDQIKSERFEGDMLEIQQSALSTPSRIGAIASTTLSMKSSGSASYVTIDGAGKTGVASASARPPATSVPAKAEGSPPGDTGGLLASIMHTAAGEAQALLLGDVGLPSSR